MAKRYALIGDGRLATSLGPYLEGSGASVACWSRRAEKVSDPVLSEITSHADTILLAISDGAILEFAHKHRDLLAGKQLVHFSGAHVFEGIAGAHPLYSFPKLPVSSEKMADIAFITEQDGPSFCNLFPMLKNKSFAIPADLKPLYHALAVLSGNLVSFTWNEVARVMQDDLSLPPQDVLPAYFQSLIDGFKAAPTDSLTGPIARGDETTITKNLTALKNQPALLTLYESLLEAAKKKGYPL